MKRNLIILALLCAATYYWFGVRVSSDEPDLRITSLVQGLPPQNLPCYDSIVSGWRELRCETRRKVTTHCDGKADLDTSYFSCYHLASK